MKRTLLILIGVAVTLTLFSCRRTQPPTPPPPSKENVFVYSFEEAPGKTVDDSKKLIEKFLGKRDVGDLYKSDENTVYFVSQEDVSETFENDLNNGNFTFNRSMKAYLGTNAPQLPGKDEAIRLAEEFLNNNGLTPKDRNQLRLVHFGGLRSAMVIEGKTAGPVIDKLVTVTYGRKVDEVPVVGPGSKVVVHLGNKGEVMGAIYRWRELNTSGRKQIQPEEMISQQEAEELAKRQVLAEYGQETSYRILGSGKAYYDNNARMLQPVYTFEVEINMQQKDRYVQPFNYLCVIPLLRNPPEPLNLIAIDPRAKELIKTMRSGEKPPEGEKRPID